MNVNSPALQFHLSIPPLIRRLGILTADCPNRILSPDEINQFGHRIDLQKLWACIRRLIPRAPFWDLVHAQIAYAPVQHMGIPAVHASREVICTWMRAPVNQTLVQEITSLNLIQCDLICVPNEIALCTALQWLSLDENHLSFLPGDLFHGLTALQGLFLESNQLVSLPGELFHGLTALQRLTFDNNHLASLPGELFQGLIALRRLSIENNRLVSLPGELFHGLTALRRLSIENNHLVSLPEELFHGLSALRRLSIENNRLVSLPGGLFRGLTALRWLNFDNNHLASLPRELFDGLTSLRRLSFANNHLVSLPERLFEGLTALRWLSLDGHRRLLVSWHNFSPIENNIAFRDVLREFFNYHCQSSFARFYQLAARGGSPEAVREAFSGLPEAIKNAIFEKVWVEAGCPCNGDLQWGEHHAFEDMLRFYGALRRYVSESFEALSDAQKNAVYGHVYHLARRAGNAEAIDFDDPQWGEHHAFDNILRLIDAIMIQ